jgi:hypothetical protein
VLQEGVASGDVRDRECSADEAESEEEANQHGDSEPEDESGDTIQNLEDVLKQLEARTVAPESPPDGPLHGLDLEDLPEEQLNVKIEDTDTLTHMGRVTAFVDGIIVVKVAPTKSASTFRFYLLCMFALSVTISKSVQSVIA